MANENKFDAMFKTSFENIKSMLDSNTVVGSPIELSNGTTIIPISKLSVGFATGGVDASAMPQKSGKFGGGGGSGMSVTPVGFLSVTKDGRTEFISVEGKTGIDPVELAEILKEAIENERIICLPDHNPENWKNQLRGLNETIENYTLTKAERDEIAAAKLKAMMEATGKAPAGGPMWAVPEGAEAFGQARKDLEWIKR